MRGIQGKVCILVGVKVSVVAWRAAQFEVFGEPQEVYLEVFLEPQGGAIAGFV